MKFDMFFEMLQLISHFHFYFVEWIKFRLTSLNKFLKVDNLMFKMMYRVSQES